MGKKSKGKKKKGPSKKGPEASTLDLIRAQHGYASLEPGMVEVGQHEFRVDGVNSTGKKIVLVNTRVGALKGAESKKLGTEILKLAMIRNQPGFENARCEIYFADADALGSVRDWMAEAAAEFRVGLKLVPGTPDA